MSKAVYVNMLCKRNLLWQNRLIRNIVFIPLILLVIPLRGYSQHPCFWQLTTDNGLPSNTVYDIFQDNKGYVWIGTEQGLTVYNGLKFRRIITKGGQSPSATFLCQQPNGTIWFLNFTGQFFQVKGDTAYISPVWEQLGKPLFTNLLCDKFGHLWLCTEYEIYEYDPLLGIFAQRLQLSRISVDPHLSSFSARPNGGLLFVATNGFFELDSDFHSPARRIGSISAIFSHRTLISNPRPLIWTGGMEVNKEVTCMSQEGDIVKRYRSETLLGRLLSINQDIVGNVWYNTSNGATLVNTSDTLLAGLGVVFPNTAISKVLLDREGNYWFGSLRSGIFIVPSLRMRNFTSSNSDLPDSRISCLTHDGNGNLLVGGVTGQQVVVFNPETERVTGRYLIDNGAEIEAIFYWNDQKKIIASGFVFDENNPEPIFHLERFVGTKCYARLDNSLLWGVGTSLSAVSLAPDFCVSPPLSPAYCQRYTMVGKSPHALPGDYSIPDFQRLQIRRQRVRSVCVNPVTKAIYGGYADGLIRYTETDECTIIDPISNESIIAWDMAFDPQGVLWVATTNQGIYCINGDSVIKHITQDDGLISNGCKTLCIEPARGIWVGTDQGINLLSFSGQLLNSINSLDGLATNEINDLEVLNNKVWVATSVGLLTFPANLEPSNHYPPLVYLPRLRAMEQDIVLNNDFNLSYDENTVTVYLEGISYRSRGSFYYRYRLIGQDTTWVKIPAGQDFVRFPSLSPGDYQLEVLVVNEDEVPSTQPAVISFTVNPPFWIRWWFIAIVFAVVIGIVVYLVRQQVSRIRRQSEVQQQLRSSQLQALRAQMNPHFIFNALNSIQEFILLSDKLQANSFLGKFADLMRLYLDASASNETPIEDEILATELYLELERLRMDGNLDFKIEFTPGTPSKGYTIPAMIIQPFIENSVKHGLLHKQDGRSVIHILFSTGNDPSRIRCVVTDNGIGREESARINATRSVRHKSFAVKAASRRLELLNATNPSAIGLTVVDLYHSDGRAAGTQVILDIPVVFPTIS